MYEALIPILNIQEQDMQMLQLMRLKNNYKRQLKEIAGNKKGLRSQLETKEKDIVELKKNIRLSEGELSEIQAKFKKLEAQQHSIKKVEEFNALNHEMAQSERERVAKEQRLSEMYDALANEETTLKNISQSLESMVENNTSVEAEIKENIGKINKEGLLIKKGRDSLVKEADPEVFSIYERLLQNKKDRVVVPIENRCCSGCHIMLTAQDENLVRKGERLVFCEHCSRIHYWQESQSLEGTESAPKTRRRRSSAKV